MCAFVLVDKGGNVFLGFGEGFWRRRGCMSLYHGYWEHFREHVM